MSKPARSAKFGFRLASALILSCVPLLALNFYLYNRSIEAEHRLIQLNTEIMAHTSKHRLESFARNRIMAVKLTSTFLAGSGDMTETEFSNFCNSLESNLTDLDSIVALDLKGNIQRIFPMQDRTPLNHPLNREPLRQASEEVQTSGKLKVLPSTTLLGGKEGIAILYPVYKASKINGVILGEIPVQPGFERILSEEVRNYWNFTITDDNDNIIFDYKKNDGVLPPFWQWHGPAKDITVTDTFLFGDQLWKITATPKSNLYYALDTYSPERVLLYSTISTLLLFFGVLTLFVRQGQVKRALDRAKTANNILVQSEKRFREMIERVHLLGIVVDRDSRIVFCNDSFLLATGRKAVDVVGKDAVDIFIPLENRLAFRALHQRVVKGNEPIGSNHCKLLTSGGKTREVIWTYVVSYDGNGEVDVITSLGEDITDRLVSEEAQRQSQKLESLGVLAGGIAHDFNNLLTAIIGHNDLALKKAGSQSPLRIHLENVARTAQRLADLTGQMLAYSGRGSFEIRDANINTIVSEMTDLVRISIPKRVDIHYDLAHNLPQIKVDTTQIEQVLLNLITNAAESIPDRPGRILLRTREHELSREEIDRSFPGQKLEPGSYIELSVQDNGSGIPPEKLSRIFDPFFTTKFTGRGLGLAVLLGIVRGHGGGIEVKSQTGIGTTFHIYFPAKPIEQPPQKSTTTHTISVLPTAPAHFEHDKPAVPLHKRVGEGTVLVVDDDESVRHLASEILKMSGFSILEASTGEEGVEVYNSHPDEIVAVLLDLTMPGMGGQATYKKLHELNPKLRIVLTSGYSNQEIERQFHDTHLAGFVQKPFLPSELLKWIFEAVESSKSNFTGN